MDILLVEDSAPMRKLVATIVKRMGVEALELLQLSKVDLVLRDWSMPVMDGLDLGQVGAVREKRCLSFSSRALVASTNTRSVAVS